MKSNRFKLISVFSLFLIAIMAISTAVSAINVDESSITVEIDGEPVVAGTTIEDVQRGEDIDIKVRFTASGNDTNVELHAAVFGYEYSRSDILADATHVFDIKEGVTYTKGLKLELPDRMERGVWNLRLFFAAREGGLLSYDYILHVGTDRHELQIKDVVFSPASSVQAGTPLIAVARIKNTGEKPEEGIKVTAKIPALDISSSDYIDELESEETTTTEELYMIIPECTPAGTYDVKVELTYDEGEGTESVDKTIVVTEDSACEAMQKAEDKTILTVGPESQAVRAGEKVIYPITISNAGTGARQYTVSAEAGDFAEISISPSNVVVLEAGEAKAVYVYADVDSGASAGEQLIAVKISSGDKVLKEMTLKADVQEASAGEKAKRILEVGLVVLVILLVIIGLVIGFNKLKGDEDEDKDESQTYY